MSSVEINTGVRPAIAKIAALTGLVASIAACHAWMPPDSTMWVPVIFVSCMICYAFGLASFAVGALITLIGSAVLLVAWHDKPFFDLQSKDEPAPLAQQGDDVRPAPVVPFTGKDVDPSSRPKRGLGPYAPIKHANAPKTMPAFDREPRSSKGKSKKSTKPKSTTVAYQSSKPNKVKG